MLDKWRGTVSVILKGDCLEIINDIQEGNDDNQDLGFGLGLQLTRQLSEKRNWLYTIQIESGQHKTGIIFAESTGKS